jgi:hypothetical protein
VARSTDDEVRGYCRSGYTGRSGDSLWQIDQRIYGDGRYWVYLYAANADLIATPTSSTPARSCASSSRDAERGRTIDAAREPGRAGCVRPRSPQVSGVDGTPRPHSPAVTSRRRAMNMP